MRKFLKIKPIKKQSEKQTPKKGDIQISVVKFTNHYFC